MVTELSYTKIETKDRRVSLAMTAGILVFLVIVLHFLGVKIPTPPLPKQLAVKDQEIELIPLEELKLTVPGDFGGGGSGTEASGEVSPNPPDQMEEFITDNSANIFTSSGGSNHTNSNNPTKNPSQVVDDNPGFGTGGTGGGPGKGSGHGFGNGEGDGKGPGPAGTGNGGGSPKRTLINKPNTNNIESDENVVITFSFMISPSGEVVTRPVAVRESTTTDNGTLISQVANLVYSQAKYNSVPGKNNQTVTLKITVQAK